MRRLLKEALISPERYVKLKEDIDFDFTFYDAVDNSSKQKIIIHYIIKKYRLKTLDAIQLSSCIFFREEIDQFVCSDKRLIKAAQDNGLKVINPSE